MIELIVVISLMGIMASLAMMRSTDRVALHEKGFRDQLAGMLRHARKLAISQQRDVCVLLAPTVASGVYTSGAGCNPAAPMAEPGSSTPFVVAVPIGVALGGPALVRFNNIGQPVPNADQVISVGTQVFTVSRETGIVF